MRSLAAAVLAFQSIVIALAIPVAVSVYGVSGARAGWIGGGVAISCLVVAGLLRHRWAYALGWAIQIFSILAGFVVPVMFVLGTIFALLWWGALTIGRKGEATRARYLQMQAEGLGPDGRPVASDDAASASELHDPGQPGADRPETQD